MTLRRLWVALEDALFAPIVGIANAFGEQIAWGQGSRELPRRKSPTSVIEPLPPLRRSVPHVSGIEQAGLVLGRLPEQVVVVNESDERPMETKAMLYDRMTDTLFIRVGWV